MPEVQSNRGILVADAVWTGDIRLTGDVVVPSGRRLVVAAGADISAEMLFRAGLRYPVERLAFGGRLPSSGAVRLIVEGELEVSGDLQRPIVFRGAAWGGVVVAKGGRAAIRGAVFRQQGGTGVLGLDFSRVAMSDCVIEGADDGAAFGGFSGASLARCRFREARRAALRLHDDAAARACGCSVEESAFGSFLDGASELWWVGGRVAKCAVGTVASGASRLRAARSLWENNGVGISVQNRAVADARALRLTGNGVGWESLGRSTARLKRVEARSNGTAAWAQNSSRLRLESGVLEDNTLGAKASHASRLDLTGARFRRHSHAALFVEEGARARARGCFVDDAGRGVVILGGARLDGDLGSRF